MMGAAAGLAYYFLPGYLAALGLSAGRLPRVAVVALGFVLSPAIAVLVLLAVVWWGGAPVPAGGTAILLLTGLGLAGLLGAITWSRVNPRKAASETPPRAAGAPRADHWMLAGLALLAVLLVPLWSPDVQMSFHGPYHVSIVRSILQGVVPPPNPGLHGAPIDTYWGFHLFLAAVVHDVGISPLLASSILRAGSLLAVFTLTAVLADRAGFRGSPWAAAVFAIFCVNLAGPILILMDLPDRWLLWTGGHGSPHALGSAMVPGDERAANGLAKFLNFNAFSYALALWVAALVAAVDERVRRSARAALHFLLTASAVVFHLPTAVGVAAVVPAAIWLQAAIRRESRAGPARAAVEAFGPPLLALLLTSPYWYGILSGYSGGGGGSAGMVLRVGPLAHNLATIAGAYILLIPVLVLGLRRSPALTPATRLLLWIAAGTLALSALLILPGANQYKFVLMAAYPLGVATAVVAPAVTSSPARRAALLVTGLVLAIASAGMASTGYLMSRWWTRPVFASVGSSIHHAGTRAYAALREWSPPDAVIVETPLAVDVSLIGAVGERHSFFRVSPWGYYNGLPEYEQRAALVRLLFTPETPKDGALRRLDDLVTEPVYLLLDRRRMGRRFEPLAREYADEPLICPLFRDPDGAVYGLGSACQLWQRPVP